MPVFLFSLIGGMTTLPVVVFSPETPGGLILSASVNPRGGITGTTSALINLEIIRTASSDGSLSESDAIQN